MQAVINISHEGTRLRPLSCTTPSGMESVLGKSLIERLVQTLKKCDITDILIITGPMEEKIKEYLGNGEKWGVKISIRPMQKENAIKTYSEILDEEFMYFSRPMYINADLKTALNFHRKNNSFATIILEKAFSPMINIDKTGRVTRFEEKKLWNSMSDKAVGTGVYILNRGITGFLPNESSITLEEGVFPSLVRSGKNVFAFAVKGKWEPVFDLASLMRANFECLKCEGKSHSKGIIKESTANVEKGALLEGPCYIGKNAHVHKGAKISAYSIVGKGCVVTKGASIKRSVIGKGVRIGEDCALRGCVLGDNVRLEKNVRIYEQAVIGDGTVIEENSSVKPFIKIWPDKTIGRNVIVSENMVWGQKKRERLFEHGEIEGVVNVDITPRFCTMLGESIGILFDMGEVGVSTDGSPAGAMIKDGLVAGLLGTGASVKDFGEEPLPITRRGILHYMLKGGVSVNVHEEKGEEICEITIIDNLGCDIEEKDKLRLADVFEKGPVLYPESKHIKECEYLFEYKLYYLKQLIKDTKKVNKKMSILLSCPTAWGRRLITSAMSDFCVGVSIFVEKDRENLKTEFANAVRLGGFDMGFILDSKCEQLIVVKKDGEIIEDDAYEVLTSLIVMKKYSDAVIYVPITSSGVIDSLSEKYACTLIRTSSTKREIMRSLTNGDESLSEQYIFRFDAVGSVIKIVGYIQYSGVSIEKLMEEIPPIMMKKTIVQLSRNQIEEALDRIKKLEDAEKKGENVKITFDKGWVVVVPDKKKDICNIVSEGLNQEFAKELCDFCRDMLMKS